MRSQYHTHLPRCDTKNVFSPLCHCSPHTSWVENYWCMLTIALVNFLLLSLVLWLGFISGWGFLLPNLDRFQEDKVLWVTWHFPPWSISDRTGEWVFFFQFLVFREWFSDSIDEDNGQYPCFYIFNSWSRSELHNLLKGLQTLLRKDKNPIKNLGL